MSDNKKRARKTRDVALKTARHHWQIRLYTTAPQAYVEYVNENTTSPQDGATTAVPLNPEVRAQLREPPVPPKRFATKSEAQPYLAALRARRRAERERIVVSGPDSLSNWQVMKIEANLPNP